MAEGDGRQADDALLAALADAPAPPDFVLSWWVRGGEPGPGYTSDKLDVTLRHGSADGVYIRARWDPEYQGGFRSEAFSAALGGGEWRELLAALASGRLFGAHFASEDRADLADAVKETIELRAAGRLAAKTLYGSDKAELRPAKDQRNRLARLLTETGERRERTKRRF
jgi:hypothetical protein